MGDVMMYGSIAGAASGYGPAGTGHPPPANVAGSPAVTVPSFMERLRLALEHAHAAADRIEGMLHRFEPVPAPAEAKSTTAPSSHNQAISEGMDALIGRLNHLAGRLEGVG